MTIVAYYPDIFAIQWNSWNNSIFKIIRWHPVVGRNDLHIVFSFSHRQHIRRQWIFLSLFFFSFHHSLLLRILFTPFLHVCEYVSDTLCEITKWLFLLYFQFRYIEMKWRTCANVNSKSMNFLLLFEFVKPQSRHNT